MKTRCRPGDLAMIINEDPGYEENIGRIVSVHGPLRKDHQLGPMWLIVPLTAHPHAVMSLNGFKQTYQVTLEDSVEHADNWMILIARKRSLKMAKITHLGSAKPDDPIYKSGPQVFVPITRPAGKSVEQNKEQGPLDKGSGSCDSLSADEMAAYQRIQEQMSQYLIDSGAVIPLSKQKPEKPLRRSSLGRNIRKAPGNS